MAPFPSLDLGTRLSNDELVPASLTNRQAAPPAETRVACEPVGGIALTGGALAGIIIGTIFGTLLLLWIFRSCFNLGAPPSARDTSWHHDVEPVTSRRRRSSRHSHHGHHRHHSRGGHSRRGSIGVVPVMVQTDGPSRSPRRPSGTYVVGDEGRGRTYYTSR